MPHNISNCSCPNAVYFHSLDSVLRASEANRSRLVAETNYKVLKICNLLVKCLGNTNVFTALFLICIADLDVRESFLVRAAIFYILFDL